MRHLLVENPLEEARGQLYGALTSCKGRKHTDLVSGTRASFIPIRHVGNLARHCFSPENSSHYRGDHHGNHRCFHGRLHVRNPARSAPSELIASTLVVENHQLLDSDSWTEVESLRTHSTKALQYFDPSWFRTFRGPWTRYPLQIPQYFNAEV